MDDQPKTLSPKLRFPEFHDRPAWPRTKLSSVLTDHGQTSDGKSEVHSVSLTNGIVPQIEHMGRSFAATDTAHYSLVMPFDIVYTRSPLAIFKLGIVKQHKRAGNAIVSPLYGVFNPKNKHLGLLIEAYFESPYRSIRYLEPLAQKGAKNTIHLSNDRFLSGSLFLPDDEGEQRKIAECLTSLDQRIAAEGRKLEALRAHRKGLTQQLCPREGETRPRLRFPEFRHAPEWVSIPIGEFFETMTGGTPDRAKKEYWGGVIPWITTSLVDFNVIREAEEFITDAGLKNSGAKLFPKGTVLVALYGQGKTRGKVALLDIAATTNQACAAILPASDFDPVFTFLSLSGRYDEMRSLSNAGGQENLSQGLLRDLPFYYPDDSAEREKIAASLSSLDAVITAQVRKLDGLRTYKKALMQQIFPVPEGM